MSKYNYTKQKNNYLTPPELIQLALQILTLYRGEGRITKFDLDACCSSTHIPADRYFEDGKFDGLTENWDRYTWCNPPFDECRKWVQKAYGEQQRGNTSILLIPVRTETSYWHEYILTNKNVDIHWIRKGPRFINPETMEPMGVFKNALALVMFKGVGNA